MGEEPHFQGRYRNVIKASLNSRVVELLSSSTPRNRAKTTLLLTYVEDLSSEAISPVRLSSSIGSTHCALQAGAWKGSA